MRVFLDTNVLASAAATRGLCADVVRLVLAEHELVTSRQVLSELRRVLRAKFAVRPALVREFVELIRQDAVMARPRPRLQVNIKDGDDLPILAGAAAGADVLVTGDRELQKLGRVDEVEILSPRQFWEKAAFPKRRDSGPLQ